MITKKLFDAVAHELLKVDNIDERRLVVHIISDVFSNLNPNFKRKKFFDACGITTKK